MIKTAVILAAGIGVRLRPLTLDTPKCLIAIDDKSILDYQLKLLINMGITNIIIVTGYLSDKIEDHIKNHHYDDKVNIHTVFNDQYKETGSCYSLLLCRKLIGAKGYIHINSDSYFSIAALKNLLESKQPDVMLTSLPLIQDEDIVRFECNHDRKITKIGRPWYITEPAGYLVGPVKFSSQGVAIFLDIIEKRIEKGIMNDTCYLFLNEVIDKINLFSLDVGNEKWFEIDTLDDLERAKKILV